MAFDRIEALNEILSDYRDGSEINRLSAQSGTGRWIGVSDDLYEVLAISKRMSRITRGTFDVTVGPVVQLWRRAMRRNIFPTQNEIKKARKAVGYRFVKLKPRTKSVRLARSGMRLDVGGIGKGYAADEAVQVVQKLGIQAVLIDAGGDLTLAGVPPGREGWEVEISSGTSMDSTRLVQLTEAGVATSGATYRYLEHEGVHYSHIVDPKTGIGLRYHVRTTVIAPNGTYADALATAFSVAGSVRSKRILRRFPQVQVWLLETKDNHVTSWNTLK
jgi:thiamine biosynthesis lipoprotein